MGTSFMEVGTEIGELLDERNKILTQVANLVAKATISRAKSGKDTSGLPKDINNILEGFTADEKTVILFKVVEKLAANGEFSNRNKSSNNNRRHNDMSDIFASRGF